MIDRRFYTARKWTTERRGCAQIIHSGEVDRTGDRRDYVSNMPADTDSNIYLIAAIFALHVRSFRPRPARRADGRVRGQCASPVSDAASNLRSRDGRADVSIGRQDHSE